MHFRRFILTGFFTAIPLVVTYVILAFVFRLLASAGTPVVRAASNRIGAFDPELHAFFAHPAIQSVLGFLVVIFALYVLGWIATQVVGKRLIQFFDDLFHRIPGVETLYGATKKLVDTFRPKENAEENVRRVVLIEFPTPEMKTIGLVTKLLKDADTGEELAAVYVPTTPNPTSGYLEIVPVKRLVSTALTLDEAMSFVISGGAISPDELNYSKSAAPSGPAVQAAPKPRPGM